MLGKVVEVGVVVVEMVFFRGQAGDCAFLETCQPECVCVCLWFCVCACMHVCTDMDKWLFPFVRACMCVWACVCPQKEHVTCSALASLPPVGNVALTPETPEKATEEESPRGGFKKIKSVMREK